MSASLSISEPAQIGLDLRIETPENVVLTYQLAGPSLRLAAYAVDLAVRIAATIALSITLAVAGVVLPGFSMGFFLLFLFVMEWGYFVVCEAFFNGKTIGKHAVGLRVIDERGYPLSFWSAMLRNLLRAADVMPAIYGVGFLTMLGSRKFQRLGDLAARTVVITERRVVLPREPVILGRIEPLHRSEIGRYIPDPATLSMIDQFLGRRYVLTHRRGHELASLLAEPLAQQLDYRGDRKQVQEFPMAFLARVYVTFTTSRDDDASKAQGLTSASSVEPQPLGSASGGAQ